MRVGAWLSFAAIVAFAAFCGFHPHPTSGTTACAVGGPSCCPEGYVCVGRGAVMAEGSTAPGLGTCWSMEDVPPGDFHDYTPTIPNDPACLVTDWLPPGLGWPGVGSVGTGGKGVTGGGGQDADGGVAGSGGGGGSINRGITAVSAGDSHTCAVVSGAVKCWGEGTKSVPTSVTGVGAGVTAISAGSGYTCAVVGGGLKCWGSNRHGVLGTGTSEDSEKPVSVKGLTAGVTAVSAGSSHTCAVVNGGLKCWGANSSGQIGNGTQGKTSADDVLLPVDVVDLSSGVTAVACGGSHTCAVVDGGVKCWGRNGSGQLGDDTTADRLVPVQAVALVSGVGVTAVSAGSSHSCAIANAKAWCWGSNTHGEIGLGPYSPFTSPSWVKYLDPDVEAISCGSSHTCAVVAGAAKCMGSNWAGKLGIGHEYLDYLDAMYPVQVVGLDSGVLGIAAGGQHSCALLADGIQCWGYNADGQLGNNTLVNSTLPVKVRL